MKLNNVDIGDLEEAALSVQPMFLDIPSEPIGMSLTSPLSENLKLEMTHRYRKHGYVIVDLDGELITPEHHLYLAESINLGESFIPPLYKLNGHNPPPVSVISAGVNAGKPDGKHPSFGKTVGQNLHSDGTLQPIGFIKATFMSCRNPASEGGDSIFFDSIGAYSALLQSDRSAALALAHPNALVRRATMHGSNEQCSGPVYAAIGGQLMGRYSVTQTDSLGHVDGADEDLARGMKALSRMAVPGSQYFRTERFKRNQAVIFDNTRISHGRTAYIDDAESPRCMYRTLHLRHPHAIPGDVLNDHE